MHEHGGATVVSSELVLGAVALAAIGCYVAAAIRTRGRGPWPLHRSVLWVLGVAAAALAVAGPLAEAAHEHFAAHMAAHLSLGMLAPLLLVLAAPVTLALRSLAVVPARRLSALLRSWPARFLVHPITATVLNVGGLWVLYTTDLMQRMHENALLAAAVNVHLLVAGYLFTASMIGRDPAPHRPGYAFRAVVLLFAFAAHGILAKYLFAHPPAGVPAVEAELGSMLMFYGGDLVDAAIVVVLCFRWYVASGPGHVRRSRAPAAATS